MNTLEKIIAQKRKEVTEKKSMYPVKLLEKSIYFNTPVVSLEKYLKRKDKIGIIAEFKRKSPSKGEINMTASVETVSIGYMQAGASALSVLTDSTFFGGKNEDLTTARKFNFCPILRKDFVIDEYQLIEARSIGADAVLLIAECLTKEEVKNLASKARALGLEVLMEVHSIGQLAKLCDDINIVGVNNRNLEDFSVNIQTSLELATAIPAQFTRISESGLNDADTIVTLQQAGYQGFLIGEHFMRSADPQIACAQLVQSIWNKKKSLILER